MKYKYIKFSWLLCREGGKDNMWTLVRETLIDEVEVEWRQCRYSFHPMGHTPPPLHHHRTRLGLRYKFVTPVTIWSCTHSQERDGVLSLSRDVAIVVYVRSLPHSHSYADRLQCATGCRRWLAVLLFAQSVATPVRRSETAGDICHVVGGWRHLLDEESIIGS
jgi:hypothetical protein